MRVSLRSKVSGDILDRWYALKPFGQPAFWGEMQNPPRLSPALKVTIAGQVAMNEPGSAAGEAHRADIMFKTSAADNPELSEYWQVPSPWQ